LSTRCHGSSAHVEVVLEPSQAKLRAQLFEVAHIIKEQNREDGCWVIDLNLPSKYKYLLAGLSEDEGRQRFK